MNRFFYSIFLFIFISSCQYGNDKSITKKLHVQNKENKSIRDSSSTFHEIKGIDSIVKLIELSSKKMRSIKSDIWGKSTEGGELIKYYSGEGLAMVKIFYYGEMGKSLNTYYRKNNNIINIKSETWYYDKPMYQQGSKVDSSNLIFFIL